MDGGEDITRELSALRSRLYELERRLKDGGSEDALPDTGELELLVCRLGDTRVAFELCAVQEVTPIAATVEIPEAPAWVHGLLDLRGRGVPVIDLLARMTRAPIRIQLSDQVVVCEQDGRLCGLVVSEVLYVTRLAASARDDSGIDVPHGPYVRAMLRDEDGVLVLLSIRRLTSAFDLSGELESTTAAASAKGQPR